MVVRTSRGITPRITSAVNMLSTFTNSTRFSRVRFSMYRRSASASFKRHIPSIVSESGHSWDIVPSPYPSCRVATSPQTGVRVNYHVGQGPKAISALIGSCPARTGRLHGSYREGTRGIRVGGEIIGEHYATPHDLCSY